MQQTRSNKIHDSLIHGPVLGDEVSVDQAAELGKGERGRMLAKDQRHQR
jgi:hypothetical protein